MPDPARPTYDPRRLAALTFAAALVVGLAGVLLGSGGRIGVVEALLVVVPFALIAAAIVAAKAHAARRPPD